VTVVPAVTVMTAGRNASVSIVTFVATGLGDTVASGLGGAVTGRLAEGEGATKGNGGGDVAVALPQAARVSANSVTRRTRAARCTCDCAAPTDETAGRPTRGWGAAPSRLAITAPAAPAAADPDEVRIVPPRRLASGLKSTRPAATS